MTAPTPRSRRDAAPGPFWGTAAAVAILATAWWIRAPSWAMVGTSAAAAAVAAIVSPRAGRARAGLFAVVAVGGTTVAGLHQRRLDAAIADPSAVRARAVARTTGGAIAARDAAVAWARQAAALAVTAPPDSAAAVRMIAGLAPGPAESGLVLYRRGVPFAWTGTVRVPVPPPGDRATHVIETLFYRALAAEATAGDRRAVAVVLLDAAPPGDVLSRSLAAVVSDGAGGSRVSYGPGDGAAIASPTVTAPPPAAMRAAALERARGQVGAWLAAMLIGFVATLWRRGAGLAARLAALGPPWAAIAVVPLNTLSNRVRLFDPSLFFSPVGGPFTGNAGAVMVSSALAVLAVLAVLRARRRPRSRAVAIAAVAAVAVAAPFLLRALSRGIAVPPGGVSLGLWLAWEVTIFLAALPLLLIGVTAGRRVIGPRQGLAPGLAPTIAVLTAAVGPWVWQAPGRWPAWYAALWAVAIAALATARRSRGSQVAAAVVAACGAAVLTWGAEVRERVELADRDVAALATEDAEAQLLLDRFIVQLADDPPPSTRAALLAQYAASDLRAAGYPADLAHWDAAGALVARLPFALVEGVPSAIEALAADARAQRRIVARRVTGVPGAQYAAAFPHGDGTVTTALAAARTRLVPEPANGVLLGLQAEAAGMPPYDLTSVAVARVPVDSTATRPRWVRRGDELHGDRIVVTGGVATRVHARVRFGAPEALAQRGTLVVLLDLAVVAMLAGLHALADGALPRWVRWRRRRWRGSYRRQLTLVVFALAVLPAMAFAAWSYRWLQDGDRESRTLLLRETLRGVAVRDLDGTPLFVGLRDTPLFRYEQGMLTAASDSLFDLLAPHGRFLPPDVARVLAQGDDLLAAAPGQVGRRAVLFGYRPTGVPGEVVAAPARLDDRLLDQRRRDLGVLVAFATALGLLAALGLSGLAARALSRPVNALRAAAQAVAAGRPAPLDAGPPPAEFAPVFSAFRQMERDLARGREAEARAQRVLAWGEMARQVAHEIKNPLTPMRLGLQHLVRAWRGDPAAFGPVLERNAERLLAEIDRLDATARTFSRYGMLPAELPPAEPVDVAAVVRDAVALERMGEGGGVRWALGGADVAVGARARRDALRDVLLNLLENARLAGATAVTVTVTRTTDAVRVEVADDGEGIPAPLVERVFEPHFSTRSSGSGLGLAIARRLVEHWGGTVTIRSTPGAGTVVTVTLLPESAAGEVSGA
jgi:signal transduction histidine kinase